MLGRDSDSVDDDDGDEDDDVGVGGVEGNKLRYFISALQLAHKNPCIGRGDAHRLVDELLKDWRYCVGSHCFSPAQIEKI